MAIAAKLWACTMYAGVAFAQHVIGARAGTVHFTAGEVSADGQPLRATPLVFPLLKNGQRVQTANGRVEILLGPAIFLRLAANGALRMVNTDLDDTRVELLKGSALVEVVEMTKRDRLEIRFGETRTEFKEMGLYRFDLDRSSLRVFGGQAEVRSDSHLVHAGRGKIVDLNPSLAISRFNPRETDDLHQWAAQRSFGLFASSPEAQEHQTHWEITPSGWSWNRDFQIRLYSPIVARAYQMKQAREAMEKAQYQKTLDQLRNSDEQRAQQQQLQQQQQAAPQPQQPAPPSTTKK
jgi:hypothetical protein